MRCDQVHLALSARLDGEELGVPERLVDRHVSTCRDCELWLSRVEAANRRLRVRAAEAAPDLSAAILAALPTCLVDAPEDPGELSRPDAGNALRGSQSERRAANVP